MQPHCRRKFNWPVILCFLVSICDGCSRPPPRGYGTWEPIGFISPVDSNTVERELGRYGVHTLDGAHFTETLCVPLGQETKLEPLVRAFALTHRCKLTFFDEEFRRTHLEVGR